MSQDKECGIPYRRAAPTALQSSLDMKEAMQRYIEELHTQNASKDEVLLTMCNAVMSENERIREGQNTMLMKFIEMFREVQEGQQAEMKRLRGSNRRLKQKLKRSLAGLAGPDDVEQDGL